MLRVYDALPWTARHPTSDQLRRLNARRRYYATIERAGFEMRLGTLKRGHSPTHAFLQKGVDTLFAVDVALAVVEEHVQRLAVIGGDRDLVPPLEFAKSRASEVFLFHGPNASRQLVALADHLTLIDQSFLQPLSLGS